MNESQRIQYSKDYLKIQGRLERRFLPVIKKVLRNQISSFTDRFLSRGFYLDSDFQRVKGVEMSLVLASLHVYSAIVYGTQVYKSLKNTKAGNMGYNEEWTKEVLKYFRDHNLRMVSNITENTRDWLRLRLIDGVQKGYGAEKIARLIRKDGIAITKARALRIVRTETVRATNYANFLAADELGFEMDKQWIAVSDERTRDSHKYLDGEVIGMDERFVNGCLFPGDPDAAASETINCRCNLGFVPKRDRDGNLINKPEEQPPLVEYEQESIEELMYQILSGSVLGFMITDLMGITDVIKTFTEEIFKGIGLGFIINDLYDTNN